MTLRLVHDSEEAGPGGLDEEALAWVSQLMSGETSAEVHETFRRWRNQSTEHALALARARTLWTRLGTALPLAERGRRRSTAMRKMARALLVAASLAVSVGMGDQYLRVWRHDLVTKPGEPRAFALADGSRLMMSGNTAVDISFAGGVRRVDLSRGEALFNVKHDPARPFVVHVADGTVRDVGTIFDVARTDDGARVVVKKGAVELASDDRRDMLVAGQAMTVSRQGQGGVQMVDATAETAWTQGRLIINDRPLSEILAAVSRHYGGRVILLNGAAGRRRFSVAIDLHHVDDWLAGLERTGVVRTSTIAGVTFLS